LVTLELRPAQGLALALVVGLVAGAGLAYAAANVEALAALWERSGGVETGVGTISLSGRVEIWSRALYAIQDFPFTGCGLGTFREVVWLLYPLFTIPPSTDVAHAHNIFLQVALDVGLPGLASYLALLGQAGYSAWVAARAGGGYRAPALGLLGGLVGLHVYGLADALAPGSKPALLFWMALGLLAAMHRLVSPRDAS
jgi:putative inorganic carbon (HCO3(-)) transporter